MQNREWESFRLDDVFFDLLLAILKITLRSGCVDLFLSFKQYRCQEEKKTCCIGSCLCLKQGIFDWKIQTRETFSNEADMNTCYITSTQAYIIIIIIIIMSCRQHGYPWPSLTTSPYRSSPLAGLQGYIPYPHIAAVCMFELVVLLLLGHMWGSIGVHLLWVRPCFSSSVLHVWFFYFG